MPAALRGDLLRELQISLSWTYSEMVSSELKCVAQVLEVNANQLNTIEISETDPIPYSVVAPTSGGNFEH
jgi:hypothetical protein